MFAKIIQSKLLINLLLIILVVFLTFTANANIVNQSNSQNAHTTQTLLNWMEKNLNKNANFTVKDLEQFFAPKFSIFSNNKVIFATPTTYHDYLYKFKQKIQAVNYDTQPFIDAGNYIVVPFILNIKNINAVRSQLLRVIAIFKFNDQGKITEWREVFIKTSDY